MITSIIDPGLLRGSATNQVPVWNNTTKQYIPSTTLSGLTLDGLPVLSGSLSWIGAFANANIGDSQKIVTIASPIGSALVIRSGVGVEYLSFNTAPGVGNSIDLGNSSTNPAYKFLGTGLTTLGGNILVNGGYIGITGDTQLVGMSAGQVTVDGDVHASSMSVGDQGFALPQTLVRQVEQNDGTNGLTTILNAKYLWESDTPAGNTAAQQVFYAFGELGSNPSGNITKAWASRVAFSCTFASDTDVGLMELFSGAFFADSDFAGDITDIHGISISGLDSAIGGTIDNSVGLSLGDVTHATNNWAIKTGLGLVQFGDELQVDGNIGFFGTTPIAQNQLATGVGATVDNVITELQRLGLVRQAA